jgi:hypothetical protein
MKDSPQKSEALESIVSNLITRFTALPKAASGRLSRGVPAELRRDIVSAWRSSGESLEGFGQRLGITGTSIRNWDLQTAPKNKPASAPTLSAAVKKSKPAAPFRPVQIVPEKAVAPVAKPGSLQESRAMCIELRSGARITGIRIEDVLELIRLDGGVK